MLQGGGSLRESQHSHSWMKTRAGRLQECQAEERKGDTTAENHPSSLLGLHPFPKQICGACKELFLLVTMPEMR